MNSKKHSPAIHFDSHFYQYKNRGVKHSISKAVIPVAGLGTRSLPFSKCIPKEMLPVIDKPTIQYIVEECVQAGIDEVIFVTSEEKTALSAHFLPDSKLAATLRARGKEALAKSLEGLSQMCQIRTVMQPQPLGLGNAISCARAAVGQSNFAVCLGDEIFPPWDESHPPALSALSATFMKVGKPVVGVVKIPVMQSNRYGIVDIGTTRFQDGIARLVGTVEKPEPASAPSEFAIIGRYVFTPDIFSALETVMPGSGGEIQLTDAIDSLARRDPVYAVEILGARYDMGNPFYFVKAQIDAALRRPELAESVRSYLESLCG